MPSIEREGYPDAMRWDGDVLPKWPSIFEELERDPDCVDRLDVSVGP